MNLTNQKPYTKGTKKVKRNRAEEESYWSQYGTDEDFLAFTRTQPSAYDGRFDYIDEKPKNQACHYRTSENSGIATKPVFCAIPLTAEQHRTQHRVGTYNFMHRDWWEYSVRANLERWAMSTGKPLR